MWQLRVVQGTIDSLHQSMTSGSSKLQQPQQLQQSLEQQQQLQQSQLQQSLEQQQLQQQQTQQQQQQNQQQPLQQELQQLPCSVANTATSLHPIGE
jgi:hypothetical protein